MGGEPGVSGALGWVGTLGWVGPWWAGALGWVGTLGWVETLGRVLRGFVQSVLQPRRRVRPCLQFGVEEGAQVVSRRFERQLRLVEAPLKAGYRRCRCFCILPTRLFQLLARRGRGRGRGCRRRGRRGGLDPELGIFCSALRFVPCKIISKLRTVLLKVPLLSLASVNVALTLLVLKLPLRGNGRLWGLSMWWSGD